MVPPAPGLFSITTGWPSALESSWPANRDTMSAVLPAASGTSSLIGLDGKVCAPASDAATRVAAHSAAWTIRRAPGCERIIGRAPRGANGDDTGDRDACPPWAKKGRAARFGAWRQDGRRNIRAMSRLSTPFPNQPSAYEDVDLYADDLALQEGVAREGAAAFVPRIAAWGAELGRRSVLQLADACNRNPPQWQPLDARGERVDDVTFHPAWHSLLSLAANGG